MNCLMVLLAGRTLGVVDKPLTFKSKVKSSGYAECPRSEVTCSTWPWYRCVCTCMQVLICVHFTQCPLGPECLFPKRTSLPRTLLLGRAAQQQAFQGTACYPVWVGCGHYGMCSLLGCGLYGVYPLTCSLCGWGYVGCGLYGLSWNIHVYRKLTLQAIGL